MLQFICLAANVHAFFVAASVIVVDPTGVAGTVPNIQTACTIAAERDTILVESGNYSAFEIVDKWVTVVAEEGATVALSGTVRVTNLSPDKKVTLVGFSSHGSSVDINNPYGLDLESDQGTIRVSNCTFRGGDGSLVGNKNGWTGVLISQCTDVAFSHCTSIGGTGQPGDDVIGPYPGRGGQAMSVSASGLTLYDCALYGGGGQSGISFTFPDAADGGAACVSGSSSLFASLTSFFGGVGGDGIRWCAEFADGGDGGDGLDFYNGQGPARLLSTTEVGGAGGSTNADHCKYYAHERPGLPHAGGPFVNLPADARSMTITPDPVREGSTYTLHFTGRPGDNIGLVVSPISSLGTFDPLWNGQQFFPPTRTFIRLGPIPGSGVLASNLLAADLGPGVQGRTFQMQALFVGMDGVRVLGTPNSLVVLDSAH